MQEKHLFEYAVVRVMPRIEREEFLNVGVIVYCPQQRFLQILYNINEARLSALCEGLSMQELQSRLHAFALVCAAAKEGGFIATLPIASRFRWLTATRSTVVQTSRVHPGFCIDAGETLAKLYTQLIE